MKPLNYVFMSFRDPAINKNLGVCIVIAKNLRNATEISWAKGINPGGEIAGYNLTDAQFKIENLELNRLYTREEMLSKGYKTMKVRKQKDEIN